MYHSHFGLDEQAFSIAVNPRYLYMSEQHKEALAHLLYGVNSGGFVMLSGEVGTGKTTIIRSLLEQLPEEADLAVVMNPSATARDLLCTICDEFAVDYSENETSLKTLTDNLSAFLVENHNNKRKSIVLIDEAQLLQVTTLEQIRLLTNLETNTEKLLQIILVGQPELNELLARPSLRQLSQRITARYHLRPLSQAETATYIKHRLTVAGLALGKRPFSDKLMAKIYKISGGIPRLINVLCDRMLLGAYAKGMITVDAKTSRQATLEVLGEGTSHSKMPSTGFYVALSGLMIILGALLWALISKSLLTTEPEPHTQTAPPLSQQRTPGKEATQTENDTQRSITIAPTAQKNSTEPLSSSTTALIPEGFATTKLDGNIHSRTLFWTTQQNSALKTLFDMLTIAVDETSPPCWQAIDMGYRCENLKAKNWSEFLSFNRPAVLTITTPGKSLAYVTLVGMENGQAWVQVQQRLQQVPLAMLGQLWTGDYTIVWKQPANYKGVFAMGSSSPMVRWLAEQFAALDHQSQPITQLTFNPALKKRVMLFQQKHQLDDDGVVGMQTLLKLNEELGLEKSLSTFEAPKTDVQ